MKILKKLFVLTLLVFVSEIQSASKYQNWTPRDPKKFLIREWVVLDDCLSAKFDSDYINKVFEPYINRSNINLIFEVGSRDAIDALAMSEFFTAPVYAFECHPDAVKVCHTNIGSNPNVQLIQSAVWDIDGQLTFHPVIPGGDEYLLGASSVFPIDSEGPFGQSQLQEKVSVEACRLDTWILNNELRAPDLLCVDVQGGTLQVLKGLGSYLEGVSYLIAEVESQKYYEGQSLVNEVLDYVTPFGFDPVALVDLTKWGFPGVMNVLFINSKLVNTQKDDNEMDLSKTLYQMSSEMQRN